MNSECQVVATGGAEGEHQGNGFARVNNAVVVGIPGRSKSGTGRDHEAAAGIVDGERSNVGGNQDAIVRIGQL